MARTSTITFAQVAQIADTMKAAGNRPTARAVRERIGSGSMGTIHKLLQQWNGNGTADDENAAPELPSSIAETLMDFVNTQIAEACEPLAAEIKTAKDEAETLADENERLCNVIDEKDTTIAALRDQLAQETGERRAMAEQLEKLHRDVMRDDERIETLRINLNESEKQRAVMEAQRDAAERRAQELADRVIHEQCATAATRQDAIDRATAAEKTIAAQRQELATANIALNACNARLEAAAREITNLQEARKTTRATPTKKAATAKKITATKENT